MQVKNLNNKSDHTNEYSALELKVLWSTRVNANSGKKDHFDQSAHQLLPPQLCLQIIVASE
jgi:hypothetical protein